MRIEQLKDMKNLNVLEGVRAVVRTLTYPGAPSCNGPTMETGIREDEETPRTAAPAEHQPGAAVMSELLPLLIGVTGHRDLREEDRRALEVKVFEIFQTLET